MPAEDAFTPVRPLEQKKKEILDRVDIVDLVSEHVTLRRSGQRLVGLCPFHSEKTPSFTVRPEHGAFKCFGCGKGGDIFSFVQFRENVPFMEAMRILADRVGIELQPTSGGGPAEGPSRADVARVNAWAKGFFRSQLLDETVGASTRAYIASRGISDETAERFGLGLATGDLSLLRRAALAAGFAPAVLESADLLREGDHGDGYATFRNRLMFPIHDATARVVGFGGRTLGDDRAKYLNTRQNELFDKGRGLYGIDLARDAIKEQKRAILVEGYTDCLAAHQAGFPETVATLGTALTQEQVDLLRRYCDQIVLLFDSDSAGEAAADRAIHVALPRGVTVRLARMPDGKDPGDFLADGDPSRFSDVLKQAVDALGFKWLQAQRRFRSEGSGTERSEAIRDFLRLIAAAVQTKAVDPIHRGLLVNQVSHLLGLARGEVDGLLARMASKPAPRGREAVVATPASPVAPPADQEQAAWGHFLEVLLSEPGAISTIAAPLPSLDRMADPRDRAIAAVVLELADSLGEFGVSDVAARFSDAADVDRVMELARRGARRANYTDTLCLAVDRIRRAERDEALERGRELAVVPQGADEASSDAREQLTRISEGLREYRGFAPRRKLREVRTLSRVNPRESADAVQE